MIIEEKKAGDYRCTPAMVLLVMRPEALNEVQSGYKEMASIRCIGSKCAQWRRFSTNRRASDVRELGDLVRLGYCGLAGRP